MGVTTDPTDPRLARANDEAPRDQAEVYLVLSAEERAKGYLQPYRRSYIHDACGTLTSMPAACAETYARDPWFYGGTYCCACRKHLPLAEFKWADGSETPMDPAAWSEEQLERVMAAKAARP